MFFNINPWNVYFNLYGEWSLYSILIIKDDTILKSFFYSRTKNVIILFALTRASNKMKDFFSTLACAESREGCFLVYTETQTFLCKNQQTFEMIEVNNVNKTLFHLSI